MPTTDVIQVFTPDLITYVGEIQTGDTKVESLLCQYMSGGLCRLEGYIMRLQHDMVSYFHKETADQVASIPNPSQCHVFHPSRQH
jgi:hypothetical protein